MPPRRKQQQTTDILETLQASVAKIFDQVQTSKATWTKNCVALYKLLTLAAEKTEEAEPGKVKVVGERAFELAFIDMLNRIMAVKKGTAVAERAVAFIGQFIGYIMEKDAEARGGNSSDDEEEGTPTTRFVNRLIRHLMKAFGAKDKSVRYRSLQLIAVMISHLAQLDPDIYDELRESLLARVNDKEAPVRAQAVTVLAKLCGAEELDELDEDERPANEVLLDLLAQDPSGEVRRAILVNIRLDGDSLSAMIQRTRDVEPATRKLVFTNVLMPNIWAKQSNPDNEDERAMGLTHPRALTIQQREDIVSNGLGDREDSVRAAAGQLVSEWVQALGAGKTTDDSAMEDILALLSTFDLVSGTTNEVAQDALKSVLVTKPVFLSAIKFDDDYWKAETLTPEKIFLARVYVDYCKDNELDEKLETALPVVTAWAFHIQSTYNLLVKQIEADGQDLQGREDDEAALFDKEEARMGIVFIVAEMLKIAMVFDYADEIGRRKLFQLVRDMISQEFLPEQLVTPCMDVIRILSNDERDLIRLVVQIMHELRDVLDDSSLRPEDSQASIAPSATPLSQPKQREDMTPQELRRKDDVDLRCLDLCIGMLGRVNGTFEDHSTLEGVLKELMIPSVMRKEMLFRERGLICLGLCSLIAPRMATGAFKLFQSQVETAPEPLKVKVLQIVFDVIMVHERDFLGLPDRRELIETMLLEQLADDKPKVRTQVCKGLAKLMLAGMTTTDNILRALVTEFLSPDAIDNQQLRQCLVYFFPIYCYSSSANQRRMMENFLPVFKTFLDMRSELEEDEEMISPAQFTSMFLDWTDPQHAIDVPNRTVDESIHLDFASTIMKEILKPTPFSAHGTNVELRKEDKKVMCQMLPKLFLPIEADDLRVRSLRLLTQKLSATRPVRDAGAFSAINRFDTLLGKRYETQLGDYNEPEYRKLEELQDLFDYLDDIFGSDDDELVEPTAKRGRKRRSESVTESETSEEDSDATPKPKKQKGRGGKRRKTADHDNDDGDSDGDHASMRRSPPTSTAPTRSMPRRAATKKVDVRALSVELEEDDDDDDDDVEATPVPSRGPKPSSLKRRQDTEDEEVPGGPPDSEDDDREVMGLLDDDE